MPDPIPTNGRASEQGGEAGVPTYRIDNRILKLVKDEPELEKMRWFIDMITISGYYVNEKFYYGHSAQGDVRTLLELIKNDEVRKQVSDLLEYKA